MGARSVRGGRRRPGSSDAARVYGPIAADLVAATPHPLAGRIVLDAGAGTGLVSRELQRADARVVALDLSVDMLDRSRGTLLRLSRSDVPLLRRTPAGLRSRPC